MLLRAYQPADRDACLALFESNAERYFSPGDRDEFACFLDAPQGFYGTLDDDNGRIVACGGVGTRGDAAVITWLMVHASRHGQGLGRTLLDHLRNQAGQLPQARRVILTTTQKTAGFFERFGFHVVRTIANGYRPGLDRLDMELPLTPDP
jgi:ribosomal protein S18 acetylase RimI-like enzyme